MTETLHQLPLPLPGIGDTLDERFDSFHSRNGWVADLLERMAARRIGNGEHRIGVKALVEDIRWEYRRPTEGGHGFKLDNSLTSRYARLLLARHPEWAAHIATRALAPERAA